MRIPVPLAWAILALSFFTAGLLRQQNDHTPSSPFLTPIVGSLLFAGVFVLLLVAAREWQRGAVPGHGVRLGSLTPLLLMLLLEKWVSLTLYSPVFHFFARGGDSLIHDAKYRGFAGVSLLLVCLLIGRFSIPTARKAWRRARPSRWPVAAVQLLAVVAVTYLLIGGLAWMLGGSLILRWPRVGSLLLWVLAGQALLAFAEEVYYRGLLLSEMERLAPRLGARRPLARRWIAILTTSLLFGMEHLRLGDGANTARHLVFTVALGLLFGVMVTLSANLHLVGGLHAWINWVLLGAAPQFVDATGRPALPAGTYIGLTLIVAFLSIYFVHRLRAGTHPERAGRTYALR